MYVHVKGTQGARPLLAPVGLSDPLKTVEAVNHLLDAARALNCSFATSTDFIALAELRLKVRNSQLSPMFDVEVNRHLAERAFWMCARDAAGNAIAIQAFRLDEADPNLAEWALGWMMGLYAKRKELVIPDAAHVPDHSVTSLIQGPVAYHGELWIDKHHKNVFEIFTRLGMLLAVMKWQPEALWALGNKAMATRGHFVRSGYVHIESSFLRWSWEPSGAEQNEWIGIAERRHLEFMISEMTSKEQKYQPLLVP
jgi:hypothetical protein